MVAEVEWAHAPPAVQDPMTTAICGIPRADMFACGTRTQICSEGAPSTNGLKIPD